MLDNVLENILNFLKYIENTFKRINFIEKLVLSFQ